MTDAKDIDKLRSSLEKLVGPSGRSLSRVSSGKRPVVGDSKAADQNKVLLYNLKGTAPSVSWNLPSLQGAIQQHCGTIYTVSNVLTPCDACCRYLHQE